jgi:hypothetical protein
LSTLALRLWCGSSSEDGASDNLVCYHGGGGWFTGFATRFCRPKGVVRLSMGIVEAGHHCSSSWWRYYKRIRDSEYSSGVARPPCAVSSARRRQRGGVQRRMWCGPRVLCFRGGICESACVRSEFGGSTLPDDVRCCNGTIAVGSAWRWSSCNSPWARWDGPNSRLTVAVL